MGRGLVALLLDFSSTERRIGLPRGWFVYANFPNPGPEKTRGTRFHGNPLFPGDVRRFGLRPGSRGSRRRDFGFISRGGFCEGRDNAKVSGNCIRRSVVAAPGGLAGPSTGGDKSQGAWRA